RPALARCLEQLEGADDVGVDEVAGVVDRAVDVALGGKVEHRRRALLGEEAAHLGTVGDVAGGEPEARLSPDVGQVLETAGVGELVEHDHPGVGLGKGQPHEVAADEPGAAGDEECLHGWSKPGGAARCARAVSPAAGGKYKKSPARARSSLKPDPAIPGGHLDP